MPECCKEAKCSSTQALARRALETPQARRDSGGGSCKSQVRTTARQSSVALSYVSNSQGQPPTFCLSRTGGPLVPLWGSTQQRREKHCWILQHRCMATLSFPKLPLTSQVYQVWLIITDHFEGLQVLCPHSCFFLFCH